MKKSIGVSGLLYHPRTQQVLLVQNEDENLTSFTWDLVNCMATDEKSANLDFVKAVKDILNIVIKPTEVFPVYDYHDCVKNRDQFVFYTQVKKLEPWTKEPRIKYAWFNFKAINKLNCPTQTKHDIIIAQRVIGANSMA